MQEMNKVQRALDKVMDLQHRIANSVVSMAERECNREPIREIEEGLLLKEFERLATYYAEVRDAANEYKEARYKEKTEMFGQTATALTQEESKDAKSDDNLILDVRDEMMTYVRESYTDMCYITDIDADVYSIYDGERQEKLRLIEYESYTQNIHVNEHKDMFDALEGDYSNLPFWARASIIEELANTDSYESGYKGMCRLVASFDDDKRYEKLLPEEREELRKRLVYKKYEELYLMLTQRYLGVLTPEMHITQAVETAKKTGSLPFFLGIPKEEFELNHGPKVKSYVEGLKEEVSDELRDVTKARKQPQKVKPRKVTVDVATKIKSAIDSGKRKVAGVQSKKKATKHTGEPKRKNLKIQRKDCEDREEK